MSLVILYWVLIVVMLVGIVGAVVPGIPGPSLILVSILIWGFATGFSGIGWQMAVVVIVLFLSAAIEFLAGYWGAKQVGASNWSQYGAVIGMVFGFLGLLPALPIGGPLVGLLVGPFLGAFVGEFLYRKEMELVPRSKLSLKASLAVVIGSLVGNLIEGILALVAVLIFIFATWGQVYGG
ncbi:MAG: DUF456 family protein [Leptolyngbyaceae cyanobacterium bins.59]|nr:DUF456 family protein [Leptolyngbyaceae cyanobacterium bins.59]